MVTEQLLHSVQLRREEVPSFKRYPFTLSAVRTLDTLRLHRGVTFLIGENGSGKSTLLEAIAVVGPRHEIAGRLQARLAGIADGVSLTHNRLPDPSHWADIVGELSAS